MGGRPSVRLLYIDRLRFADSYIKSSIHDFVSIRYYKYMFKKELTGGTVHKMPADLQDALLSDKTAAKIWPGLTSLARNEFICWVENAKQIETRQRRIKRTCEELNEGKRRPCCWMGCVHRSDKQMSPSQRWVLGKQPKSK